MASQAVELWLPEVFLSLVAGRRRDRHAPQHQESEADRIVRELAELTGESITDAVIRSVRDRLERERANRRYERRHAELMMIRERYQELPLRNDRPADEILGYDEHGLRGE